MIFFLHLSQLSRWIPYLYDYTFINQIININSYLTYPSNSMYQSPSIPPLYEQAGKARTLVAVCAKLTSAARLLVSPASTWPPALFHFGSSCAITVAGASFALSRWSRLLDSTFALPTLKHHDTNAPYWFALRRTADVVLRVMVCW
jgi:hypothetical protein